MGFPRRMTCRGRSIRVSLLFDTAREHGGIVRLAYDDLRLRPLLREHPRYALQRASGAKPRHPVVQLLALEIVHDLSRRCSRVHIGVGLVGKLARQKPTMR